MHYKDLEVWKDSIKFVKSIYILTNKFPQEEKFGLVSQIRRAAVSIPSNIAEGCTRYSDKDTRKFIDIALGSLAELDTQLILAEDLGFANYSENLSAVLNKIGALLRGLKKYVGNN